MEHNMAQLLRASKYAAYNPDIPQVWHNMTRFRSKGEWGFKRTVNPERVKHHLVTLARMDDVCNYTHFDYAEKKVKAVHRFVKNFGNTPQPGLVPRKEEGDVASFARDRFPESVDTMSLPKWEKYLESLKRMAPALRKEWSRFKKSHNLEGKTFEELTGPCMHFLNLHLAHPGAAPLSEGGTTETREYLSALFGISPDSLQLRMSDTPLSPTQQQQQPLSSQGQPPQSQPQGFNKLQMPRLHAGPTYSHPQKVPSRKVRGRVLNSLNGDRSHFVVAVSGVTASLTGTGIFERASNASGAFTREVSEFWVKSADTDRNGNPVVMLKSESPLTAASLHNSFRNSIYGSGRPASSARPSFPSSARSSSLT